MARKFSFNAPSMNAELSAADAVINPLLDSAKITSIKVGTEDKPAGSVPLDVRIKAYADVVKSGASDCDATELATLNGQITAQLEKVEGEVSVARASLGTVTQEKNTLSADLTTARSAVSKLTADISTANELKDAATKEAGRVAGLLNGINSEISRVCLAHNVLTDLKDAHGALLPSTATAAEKEAAANLIPAADKLKALCGAVSAYIAKTGVDTNRIPATNGTETAPGAKKLTATEECRVGAAKRAQATNQ